MKLDTLKERADELSALQERFSLDPVYMEHGVKILLLMRMASWEEWSDVIKFITSEREKKK